MENTRNPPSSDTVQVHAHLQPTNAKLARGQHEQGQVSPLPGQVMTTANRVPMLEMLSPHVLPPGAPKFLYSLQSTGI